MYQYDPEAYRQLHDEKAAQLRSDFQRPEGQRRSNVAEHCARLARSVRLRAKFVTIGALIAALAVTASAAGQGVRARHARAQTSCPQAVVFPPGAELRNVRPEVLGSRRADRPRQVDPVLEVATPERPQ
jgi:hypothetical protein